MAIVVVIGGGLGGLASAARLAKLGHEVTLLERSANLGGAVSTISRDGFTWNTGPTSTLLPAVVRDLFRKTGRPLEQEISLVPLDPVRRHRFADGTSVALPGGSRAAQTAALRGLAPGPGDRRAEAWLDYVASYSTTWKWLREDFLERPYDAKVAAPEVRRLLASRESLAKRIRTSLPDSRLQAIAAFPALLEGHELHHVPAWVGVEAYLVQRFGAWGVRGGFHALTDALTARLALRGVAVRRNTSARDLVVRGGRAVAVDTSDGVLDCEVIVCAVDPQTLPTLRAHVCGTRSTTHPRVCHLAIDGPGILDAETVWHDGSLLVARPGSDYRDAHTLTLLQRGAGDPVATLASHGLDLHRRVLIRIDQDPSAADSSKLGSRGSDSSAYGVMWRGRGTVRRRLGPTTPIPGAYAAGSHANPGAGVPWSDYPPRSWLSRSVRPERFGARPEANCLDSGELPGHGQGRTDSGLARLDGHACLLGEGEPDTLTRLATPIAFYD
jgi:phytoene dehydrogenase-like protein